jgi:sugar (pentulose or hexulose) kinase
MTKPYLLGVDAGTSLVKAVIFDYAGDEIGISRTRIDMETNKPGWAEQDMQLVWQAVKKTIADCLKKNKIPSADIAAIGITGQGDGCRLLNQKGQPIRKAILWLDGRACDSVEKWQRTGLEASCFTISGSVMFAGAPAAVIDWLSKNEIKALKKAAHFLFAKDWIKFRFTGHITTDPSDASRAPYDIHNGTYSESILETLGLSAYRSLLPPIYPSTQIIGEITTAAAKETGLKAGTPVVNGMIDVVSCGIGMGAINHGQTYTIMGTTCFNGVVMGHIDLKPPGIGLSLPFPKQGHMLRAIPNLAGTPNLDWFVDQFCDQIKKAAQETKSDHFDILEQKAAKIRVGSEGVIYQPYIYPGGERAPFVKPSAVAQFFGLKLWHTKWHMLRAVYEGVALSILDCLKQIPLAISEIMLCGGGAKSDLWCQIISDATGKVVNRHSGDEKGALGAAMVAGVGVGIYNTLEQAIGEPVKTVSVFYPDEQNNQEYRVRYDLYKSLYQHQ